MERVAPADNPLSRSLYELERMVAFSPTFQSITGSESWTDARDRVAFIEDDTDPFDFPRPTCVITQQDLEYDLRSGGTRNHMRPNGSLWIYLAIDPPDEYRLTSGSKALDQMPMRKNQLFYASNVFGSFVDDLSNAAGTDQTLDGDDPNSNLGAVKIRLMDMVRTPENLWASMGQFWYAMILVHWGDG